MKAIISLLRPAQWTKNTLVFAALLFSKRFLIWQDIYLAMLTFIAFSLVAGSVYIINDLHDREEDRLHPVKRNRSLASGKVKTSTALLLAVVVFLAGCGIGYKVNFAVFLVLVLYFLVMLLYSFFLKRILLLDVFIIALGFTSRAVIGGLAIEVLISNWLLVCTFFIGLMLALTKRRQELARIGSDMTGARRSLHDAPPLIVWDLWIMMVSAVTILAYTLYTTDPITIAHFGTGGMLFTVPVVVFAIFRYQVTVYCQGGGEDPAGTLLHDKWILLAILVWILMVFAILIRNLG